MYEIDLYIEREITSVSWQLVAVVMGLKTMRNYQNEPKIKGKIRQIGKENFLVAVVFKLIPGMTYIYISYTGMLYVF